MSQTERQEEKVAENASNKRKWGSNHNGSLSQQNKGHKVPRAHTAWPIKKKAYAGSLSLYNQCKFHHSGPYTTANKKRLDNTSKNNQNQQQPNKRQNTGRAYTARHGEKKHYSGSKPLYSICNYHHDGPCAPKCHQYNRFGHLARDYDPAGYKVVTKYMLHGLCVKDARYVACTNDDKCLKHFPNPFLAETFLDEEGYPHYHRRDNKLSFHLPNQNTITLRDYGNLPALLQREGIDVTMFTDWFELNKRDPTARTHTYADILKHYVWHEQKKLWLPRKQRKCIGRIVYLSPAFEERYYLRMLLNVVRGVTGFEHLMTVKHRLYATFKEVCFTYGLLNDDMEWTKALLEARMASLLLPAGMTAYSRFVIPLELMENSMCRIKQNTQLAELMQEVHLISWDEAPMTQRYAFEALDITLRDILGFKITEKRNQIFGGMTVVIGGFHTTRSTRLNEYCANREINTSKQEFNHWVLAMDDGTLPAKMKDGEDEPTWIDIPEKFLIKT
uniref:ATP-dependent DNA helicase n=1 Tax=Tanacetum cinerariifolium TaxID=118510 RepID=A0A6L2K3T7_TANCI|nr:DNA helicase PIF1, ATP-dependent [Tanacetum cinerariifolium]